MRLFCLLNFFFPPLFFFEFMQCFRRQKKNFLQNDCMVGEENDEKQRNRLRKRRKRKQGGEINLRKFLNAMSDEVRMITKESLSLVTKPPEKFKETMLVVIFSLSPPFLFIFLYSSFPVLFFKNLNFFFSSFSLEHKAF